MVATKPRRMNASTECVCCRRRVYRMHGLIVLVRYGDSGVAFRVACVGYCLDHRAEALDLAVAAFGGKGRVVAISPPELVRPSRQQSWRRAVSGRLARGGQDLLASAVLVGEPLPYPTEPVPAPGASADASADASAAVAAPTPRAAHRRAASPP